MSTDNTLKADGAGQAPARRFSVGPGELWALGSSLSYALYNFVSRLAVLSADPLAAPVYRMIPTLAFAWYKARTYLSQLRPSSVDFMGWRVFWILAFGGFTTTVVGNVAYFYALDVGGVVLTAPVIATNLLWGALFAALFLHERLAPRMLVGILIAVVGIGLLGYGRSTGGGDASSDTLLGVLLGLLAAAGWAATSVTQRYALQRDVEKHLTLASGQTVGVVMLIALLFLMGRASVLWAADIETVGLFVVVGVLGTMALVFMTYALALTTVASATTIVGANPVISTALAVLFLDETLNLLMAFGTVLTVVGVLVFQLTKPKD